MAEPFLSEIRIFSFSFAPRGWAICKGQQLLPVNQNQALFALLGTTYGGDGRINFALPDLGGRAPMHFSANHPLGSRGGEVMHTLSIAEMPAHTHVMNAMNATPAETAPHNNMPGTLPIWDAVTSPVTAMDPRSITSSGGGGQAHLNMQPFLVLNFCIALQGIFPSQN